MTEIDEMISAIERDNLEVVRALLERNRGLVRQQDPTGATALHHAAFHGRRNIALFLVERGADINARDREYGATPAGWAIEYLREMGGHLAIELEDLAYAIQTRDAEWVTRFLTRFPALRTGKYRDGTTFRQLAMDSGDPRISDLFADVPE
jgi:ankyrin repeat protein